MIKLIITDLDGTFLNSHGDFDRQHFKKVSQLLEQKGIAFAACTGKQCERVEELFGEEAAKIWILGDSATRIKHQGEYVFESLLPNALGQRLIQQLEQVADDHVIIACTPTAAYIKETTNQENAKKVRGSYRVVKTVASYQEFQEDFVKVTVYDPKLRCFDTVKHLDSFAEESYIVASEAAWIDITNQGVHKGTTVAKLQEQLAVSKEETMVFGDGLNDSELMAAGTYSFAMKNAFEEIKEAAAFVTRSNDEDGVLRTIELLLALQESNH
ncbi:HAD family hydrolase [Enterococcus sp.]|uniref:Cof-type HAD-IIB family hydrolase n=1 Tax=Enterococcus sp. TaxID=35783 RepID=UPI0025BD3B58|nr:HAD family hydrolase [Enterococcus sp.]